MGVLKHFSGVVCGPIIAAAVHIVQTTSLGGRQAMHEFVLYCIV